MELTHINEQGRARMVDVTEKAVTYRTALAEGRVRMSPETLELVRTGGAPRETCWQWRRWRESWRQNGRTS